MEYTERRDEQASQLARIEAKLDALHERLLNTGTGLCVVHQREVQELFRRMNRLEASDNQRKGSSAVIATIVALVITAVIGFLSKYFGKR